MSPIRAVHGLLGNPSASFYIQLDLHLYRPPLCELDRRLDTRWTRCRAFVGLRIDLRVRVRASDSAPDLTGVVVVVATASSPLRGRSRSLKGAGAVGRSYKDTARSDARVPVPEQDGVAN
jgi:hypothetical protein